jgi:hypothetical protein
MGIAAATAVHAVELFNKLKPIVGQIPTRYKDNYLQKLEDAKQLAKTATDKAKNVCFEKIPDFKQIPMPESRNFVNFDDSVKEDFLKVPAILSKILSHSHTIHKEKKEIKNEPG